MTEDLDEGVRRGQRAAALLSDEFFEEAFTKLKNRYLAEWRAGKTVEAREGAHARMTALEDIGLHFKEVMDNGKIAEHRKKNGNRQGSIS
jgi:hypothetical protein